MAGGYGAVGAVRIQGIHELERSFGKYGKELKKRLDRELQVIAEPVRFEASGLARSEISHMTNAWSQMRVGVARADSTVYVSPKKRGQKTGPKKRPNLGRRLQHEALDPALQHNRGRIEARVEKLVDLIADGEGFL